MYGLRGMGDCDINDYTCLTGGGGGYEVIGPPALTPNPTTCAFNDLNCLRNMLGITQSNPAADSCNAGDTACLAQVAGTFNAPPTQPPAPAGTGSTTPTIPFCGTGSKQWVKGVDNCTVLEVGAVGVGVLILLMSSGSSRRRR